MASITHHPIAFASCSIGLPRHTLHQKIEALREAGFDGIELSFPDLQAYAGRHFGREIAEDNYTSLCEAGKAVRAMCAGHGMKILVLQPFSNFEGWPEGSEQRQDAFARAKAWIDIMEAVGTDMLQVGSSDSPDMSQDIDQIAADLACLADMLALRGFRLAYENWCWATRAPTWKDVWTIVKKADRPNIGLCLDTFQTAGGEWGDPTTLSGRIEEGGITPENLSRAYAASLDELAKTVPADKIYFVQISDAYHLEPPMDVAVSPASGLRPRGRWSHEHRPLPYVLRATPTPELHLVVVVVQPGNSLKCSGLLTARSGTTVDTFLSRGLSGQFSKQDSRVGLVLRCLMASLRRSMARI